MLFGDGAAALLISNNKDCDGLNIGPFYSLVDTKGKQDMAWELSSKGFLMTLSGYVPDLIEKDFNKLVDGALSAAELDKEQITDWCIHPGGKKFLKLFLKALIWPTASLIIVTMCSEITETCLLLPSCLYCRK